MPQTTMTAPPTVRPTDEATPLGPTGNDSHTSAPTPESSASPTGTSPSSIQQVAGVGRTEYMINVRESNEHDHLLFDGMRDQTYQMLRHIPEVEAIRKAGMTPMFAKATFMLDVVVNGVAHKATIPVTRQRRGKTTILIFHYGPATHVWCMASAAKINLDDRINDFTWLLINLIEEQRPRNVFTANLSRLIRSLEQAGLLLHAMVGNVDAVWHGMQRLPLSGPEAATGKFQYNMLASFAAMERHAIVQRTVAGRIARYRMGRWILGKSVVPPGYVYDTATGTLRVDESQRELVAAVIDVLGNGGPPRAVLLELGRLGLKAKRAVDEDGVALPVSGTQGSTSALDAQLAWLSTWVHGEYIYRLANPDLEIEELSGVPVVRRNERDAGEFQMLLRVPLPNRPWASEASFERAIAVARQRWNDFIDINGQPRPLHPEVREACIDPGLAQMMCRRRNDKASTTLSATRSGKRRNGPTGGAARESVAPLLGQRWTVDGITYRLGGMKEGTYRLSAIVKEDS